MPMCLFSLTVISVWGQWGQWTVCSATCRAVNALNPTRTRTRSCIQGTCNTGSAVEVSQCTVPICQTGNTLYSSLKRSLLW